MNDESLASAHFLNKMIILVLLISLISAGHLTRTSASLGSWVGNDGYLMRGRRDLIYWNRATNSFRKYGRNRTKSDTNDQNLFSQIRKHYLEKESANSEKLKMIRNIIRSLEKSDKNHNILNISAFATKNS